MSDLPPEELDVPIVPVARAVHDRRRAAIVTLAIVAVVGAGIGLTNLDRPDASTAVVPSAAATPGAEGTPTDDVPRRQFLPPVVSVPLPNAPTPLLVVRAGTDAEVYAWTAGDSSLKHLRTFPGAFARGTTEQYVMLSPDARFVVSLRTRPSGVFGSIGVVRLTAETGVIWEREGVSWGAGAIWSPGGNRLALVGGTSSVILAEVGTDGRVTEREIPIDDATIGGAVPSARPGPDEEPRFAPIAFSVDGGSAFAARFNEATRTIEPAFRLGFEDGIAEPITTFPNAGPGGLSSEGHEFGFIDPVRGRALQFQEVSGVAPPSINVLEPNGEVAFETSSGWLAGISWDDAGNLTLLDRDDIDVPAEFRLTSFDGDGQATVLFETPPVARALLNGIRDGYAALTLQVDDPRRTQLILIATDGRAVSGVEVGPLAGRGPDGTGWLR